MINLSDFHLGLIKLWETGYFTLHVYRAPFTLYPYRSHNYRRCAMNLATLSLHVTLFSDSLRTAQNLSPCPIWMVFTQRFFCVPLFVPPFTVFCTVVLASPTDLDRYSNHLPYVPLPLLRCHHSTRWLAWYLAASLMMWCLNGTLSSFLKHLIAVRCQCLGFAVVQDYRDNQGAHESDL